MVLGNQPLPVSAVSQTVNKRENLLNNKYVVLEEVGRGAYGVVRRGRDVSTNEEVAIKEVKLTGSSQEQLQDVLGEIDLLKSLQHEHIVKYLDSFKTRTMLYIILEFMEKGDLSSTLKPNRFGVFPEPLAAVYIAQVLQGLAYLHEQGVVHRDIKGANILTTKEGLVKLADFGVATSLQENDSSVTDVVGTPYWMAPEVIEMTEVTAASDVWSVGCLVIELLTGHPPYYEYQPMSALFRIVQDPHPPLPEGVSPNMEDFLLQCFQKEPNLRPDTRTLLSHPWIRTNKSKQNIRATWSRTQGNRARKMAGAVHESVSSVVNRILQSEADAEEDVDARAGSRPSASPASGAYSPSHMTEETADAMPPAQDDAMASRPSWEHNSGMIVGSGFGSISFNPMLSFPRGGGGGTPLRRPPPERPIDEEFDRQEAPGTPNWGSDSARGQAAGEGGQAWDGSPTQGPVIRLLWKMSHGLGEGGPGQPPSELLGWAMSGGAPGVDAGAGAYTPVGFRPAVAMHGVDGAAGSPAHLASPLGMSASGMAEDDQDRLAEMRRERDETKRLIAALRPEPGVTAAGTILNACQQLVMLLADSPDRKAFFIDNAGVVAIMELLDLKNEKTAEAALELLNAMAANDVHVLEALCLMGMIPVVTTFAAPGNSNALRRQAALFLHQLCFAAAQTMQMLIACRGLQVLVSLVEVDYKAHRDLIYRGVSCLWHILEMHGVGATMADFCRILAHHSATERLVSTLKSTSQELAEHRCESNASHSRSPSIKSANTLTAHPTDLSDFEVSHHLIRVDRLSMGSSATQKRAAGEAISVAGDSEADTRPGVHEVAFETRGLLEKTANLLLVFSKTDSAVRARLCRQETLARLFGTVPHLEPYAMLKILRCIRNLTMDENMLATLQAGETIKRLVNLLVNLNSQALTAASGGSRHTPPADGVAAMLEVGDEHLLQILHALNNLCRVNKQCQERAAEAGAVRPLCALAKRAAAAVGSAAKLRNLAISMLCRLAHASNISRGQLLSAHAMEIFLPLTSERRWQAPALDAIAAWLAEDLMRIEPMLLQEDSVKQITFVFDQWRQQQQQDGANVREMKGLLEVFHRILSTSRRLNVALSTGALPGLVVAMLAKQRPMTVLPLLKIVRSLYEAHNHPKAFIIQHGILNTINSLAKGESNHKMAVVAKQAQYLLDAFQINSIM